jgi:hypothetical protein
MGSESSSGNAGLVYDYIAARHNDMRTIRHQRDRRRLIDALETPPTSPLKEEPPNRFHTINPIKIMLQRF